MNETIISLKNVNKFYDNFKALDNISLEVKKGQIFGYLGPNGAGKTTTIKILLGLLEPSAGTVEVLGGATFPNTPETFHQKYDIGSVLEFNGLIPDLTGLDNLIFWAGLYGIDKKSGHLASEKLIKRVELSEWKDTKVSKYSYGMQKRLTLARSLISDLMILILDEPTMGIDPESRHLIRELIQDLAKKGKTIFFSSHDLEEVQKICTHLGIIKKGRLIFNGSLSNFLNEFGKSKRYIRLKSNDYAEKLAMKLTNEGYQIKLEGSMIMVLYNKDFNVDLKEFEIIDSWKGEISLEEGYLEMVSEEKE